MNNDQYIRNNLKRNYITTFLGVTFYLFATTFRSEHTILPLFISKLNNNPMIIGLLSAIISTGSLIPQLFAANWIQRTPVKKYIAGNIGFFAERLPLICLIFAAWSASWSKTAALILGLICISWYVVGSSISMVAWQDMMAKLIPTQNRGRFLGITLFVGTGVGALLSIFASKLLENNAFPTNFMVTFGFAAFFIMVSWIFLMQTKEPPDPVSPKQSKKVIDWEQITNVFKRDVNFRRYLYYATISALGLMAVGFLAIYTKEKWQISDSQVVLFTTFFLCGQAAGFLSFGWLADRVGNKLVLEINALISIASMIIAISAQTYTAFFVVFTLRGIFGAGTFLLGMNIVFDFSEPEIRPTYIGLTNTVIGIFSGIAPILGGLIVTWVSYPVMFGIAASLSLLGLIILRAMVIEPRKAKAATPEPPHNL